MGEFIKTQNSFASGQVDSEFFARDDINGLSQLENMDVIAGGGLTRRRGLVSVADLQSTARLIPFSVSEEGLKQGFAGTMEFCGPCQAAVRTAIWHNDICASRL